MAAPFEELPLFPLSTVLFPYAHVRLHVFEERYRQLVHDCLAEDGTFGIVLIRSGSEVGGPSEPYLVGTAVRILKVDKFDDGRMDIQVVGERRFRIRRLDESKPYLTGFVEPVIEIEPEDTPRADALALKAREDFQLWVTQTLGRRDLGVQIRFPEDRVALSFAIANALGIDDLEKQRLLELTDTVERLAGLIPHLEMQIIEADVPTITRLHPQDLAEYLFKN